MGAWGITMRESDYGLDLFGTIVEKRIKQTAFTVFNAAEALEEIKLDIMEEIRQSNRGCSAKKLVYYFGLTFPQRFSQGAVLVAECLDDFYRTGELVVYEWKDPDLIERHIKEITVTSENLKILLDELESVQDPESEFYRSWIKEETRQEWLAHIRAVHQNLLLHGASEGVKK